MIRDEDLTPSQKIKRHALIEAVTKRWPARFHPNVYEASDAAIEALDEGKSLSECMQVAEEYILTS